MAETSGEITLLEVDNEEFILVEESTIEILETVEQGPVGPKGDKGDPGVAGTVAFVYPAAYAISGHKIVLINNTGKAEYGSSDTIEHANRLVGMTTNAALQNESLNILSVGEVTEPSWNWQLDKPVYLGLNGNLTQVEPVYPTNRFSVVVGFPITATTLFLNIGYPIILN